MIDRRGLIRGAAAGLSAAALSPGLARAGTRRTQASDTVRLAVVGVRGRGGNLINSALAIKGVEIVALCDVDSRVLGNRASEVGEAQSKTPATYVDIRKLLERDDVDAVAIATPNHLHALHSIWACQAGKDVYVEKPMSHNIFEGQQMIAAAKKYGRVVQTGTQSRSSHALRDAFAWMNEGNLGAVTHGWGTCFKPRQSIGKVDGPQPIPEEVRYDLYQGPRGVTPLTRKSLHYDWHWQAATGNGDLGNQGVHQVDQVRWGLGHDALCPAVITVGGRVGYDDDGDTPNTALIYFDYPERPMVFEVRGLPKNKAARADGKTWRSSMDRRLGHGIGAAIHADGGTLVVPNYSSAVAYDAAGKEVQRWKGTDDHMANFIAAVRAQDPALVNAPPMEGHLSAGLCHVGNDSLTLGSPRALGEMERALASTPLAAHAFDRMRAHLDANEIDLGQDTIVFGATLQVDPETEKYSGHPGAAALWRGSYAEGFEVPDEV